MCGSIRIFFSRWRYWIGPTIFITYGAFLFGLIPYVIYKLVQGETGVQSTRFAWLIGGIFVLLTIPISLWEIIQHLVNHTKPKLQKHIIRILWMVPVYSLDAWLVLWQPHLAIYLDTARECYEAYVIYNFMMFLLNFLEMELDLNAALESKSNTGHVFPLCCLETWPMGRSFIHRCKHGILQYTVFHMITTTLAFLFGLSGLYIEGNFALNNAFIYLFFVNNLSQFVAMYCLVLFYRAMKDELKPMKPLAKFICIKFVVFFSFFQGVLIMFLVKLGMINDVFGVTNEEDLQRISNVLQNFLICVEMFIAAIAHHYAFSYRAYVDPEYQNTNCCHAFLLIWDVSDVRSDIREHVHVVSEGMKRHLTPGGVSWYNGRSQDTNCERSRLIPPERKPRYLSTSDSEHDYPLLEDDTDIASTNVVKI